MFARHDVAYRVDIPGTLLGCEIEGWFDELPVGGAPVVQVSVRPVVRP